MKIFNNRKETVKRKIYTGIYTSNYMKISNHMHENVSKTECKVFANTFNKFLV